jgi:AcrR family transcriptional regulator
MNTPDPPRRAPSARTRGRLVAATQAAIAERGIEGATAREITRRAEANLSAIPYHFGSKDALVAEALVAEARDVLDPVLALLAADGTPAERAMTAATALNARFAATRDRIPAVLAAIARAPHDPALAGALATIWADVRHRIADDVAALVDAGHAPSWVVPDAMAALVVAVVSGVLVGAVVDPDGPSHAEVGAQFVALLLAAAGGAAS